MFHRRTNIAVLFLGICLGILAPGAQGHPQLQDPVWLLVQPDGVRVRVGVSLREILIVQQVALDQKNSVNPDVVRTAASRHGSYVLSHIHLSVDGEPMPSATIERIRLPESFRRLAGASLLSIEHLPPPGRPGEPQRRMMDPEQLRIEYDLLYRFPKNTRSNPILRLSQTTLEEHPFEEGVPWEVTYVVKFKRSPASPVEVARLRRDAPVEIDVSRMATPGAKDPLDQAFAEDAPAIVAPFQIISEFVREGIRQVIFGAQHLLFVAALVVAAMSIRDTMVVFAAFAIGQTAGLALAVFQILQVPHGVTSVVVGASALLIAFENVFLPWRSIGTQRHAMALVLGGFHGLDYAANLLFLIVEIPAVGLAAASYSAGILFALAVAAAPIFVLRTKVRDWTHGAFEGHFIRLSSIAIFVLAAYHLLARYFNPGI